MKIKYKILCLLLALIFHNLIFAQSDSLWKPVGLSASGSNIYNGVEMFYQFSDYNGELSCILKFINHNNNKVEVEWTNALFTNDLTWHECIGDKNIIKLEGRAEIKGEYGGSELFFFIKEIYSGDSDNILSYRAFSFNITKEEQ